MGRESMPADRLRVVFLAHAYPRFAGDPVGSFAHNLAVALRAEAVDVSVVAPAAPGYPASDRIDGIAIERFRYAPRRLETLSYTGAMAAEVQGSVRGKLVLAALLTGGAIALTRVARRERASLVHAHWWFPAGLIARGLRALAGVPYVVTFHGTDIRLAASSAGGRRMFRVAVGHSAALTAVSSWLARSARTLDPALVVEVAPMPVLTTLFHPGGAREPGRMLFVGKSSAQKGLDRLLRAMAQMHQPAPLTVVGAGRLDDAALHDLATRLGVADRVEWLPMMSQRELAEQYRRCAVHVIPALDEGLGLTAVEALLSETPVVAFDSGGVPDVVLHDRTGLLVPAGDEAALARSLDDLLADPGRLADMGRAGRAHALAAFSPGAVARRYAAIYRAATRDGG